MMFHFFSDNGKEFVAGVIKEFEIFWPRCKLVHGRPRHPQCQGSVERANQDVENMLRSWMFDRKSTKWSEGCFEIQVNNVPFLIILKVKVHCKKIT